jgi:hypothetical protein
MINLRKSASPNLFNSSGLLTSLVDSSFTTLMFALTRLRILSKLTHLKSFAKLIGSLSNKPLSDSEAHQTILSNHYQHNAHMYHISILTLQGRFNIASVSSVNEALKLALQIYIAFRPQIVDDNGKVHYPFHISDQQS